VGASNFFMFVLGMFWVSTIIKYNKLKIALTLFKVIISASAMAFLALLLKNYLNIFLVIVTSGLAYFIILFVFKGFRKEDVISMYRAFVKKSV